MAARAFKSAPFNPPRITLKMRAIFLLLRLGRHNNLTLFCLRFASFQSCGNMNISRDFINLLLLLLLLLCHPPNTCDQFARAFLEYTYIFSFHHPITMKVFISLLLSLSPPFIWQYSWFTHSHLSTR